MPPDSIIVRTTDGLTASVPSDIAARSAVLNDLLHVGEEPGGVHSLACSDKTVKDWLACVRTLHPQEVSQSSDQSISLLTRYLQAADYFADTASLTIVLEALQFKLANSLAAQRDASRSIQLGADCCEDSGPRHCFKVLQELPSSLLVSVLQGAPVALCTYLQYLPLEQHSTAIQATFPTVQERGMLELDCSTYAANACTATLSWFARLPNSSRQILRLSSMHVDDEASSEASVPLEQLLSAWKAAVAGDAQETQQLNHQTGTTALVSEGSTSPLSVSLRGICLPFDGVQKLLMPLAAASRLEALEFCDLQLSGSNRGHHNHKKAILESIATVLARCCHLHSLSLCRLDDGQQRGFEVPYSDMLESLKQLSALTKLSIEMRKSITTYDCEMPFCVPSLLKSMGQLRSLSLNCVSSGWSQDAGTAVTEALQCLTSLRHLSLCEKDLPAKACFRPAWPQIFHAVACLTALESLSLLNMSFKSGPPTANYASNQFDITMAVRALTRLKQLELSWMPACSLASADRIIQLADAIRVNGSCTSLILRGDVQLWALGVTSPVDDELLDMVSAVQSSLLIPSLRHCEVQQFKWVVAVANIQRGQPIAIDSLSARLHTAISSPADLPVSQTNLTSVVLQYNRSARFGSGQLLPPLELLSNLRSLELRICNSKQASNENEQLYLGLAAVAELSGMRHVSVFFDEQEASTDDGSPVAVASVAGRVFHALSRCSTLHSCHVCATGWAYRLSKELKKAVKRGAVGMVGMHARHLPCMRHITSLTLAPIGLSPDTAQLLAAGLQSATALCKLEIATMKSADQHVVLESFQKQWLAPHLTLIAALAHLRHLQHLHLSLSPPESAFWKYKGHNVVPHDYTSCGLAQLSQQLATTLSALLNLRTFLLRELICSPTGALGTLLEPLGRLPVLCTVEVYAVRGSCFGPEDCASLARLLRSSASIRKLNVQPFSPDSAALQASVRDAVSALRLEDDPCRCGQLAALQCHTTQQRPSGHRRCKPDVPMSLKHATCTKENVAALAASTADHGDAGGAVPQWLKSCFSPCMG